MTVAIVDHIGFLPFGGISLGLKSLTYSNTPSILDIKTFLIDQDSCLFDNHFGNASECFNKSSPLLTFLCLCTGRLSSLISDNEVSVTLCQTLY